MPYIGQEAATTYSTRLAVQQFNGDGSTTAFTLNQSVSADQDILVSVDGVVQDTSAYTVSNGTTLTFSPAPSSGTANIFVNYLGLAVGTVTHPATQGLTATTGTFSDALTATTGAFSGKITADAGIDIDNINIDGTTIALSSGDLIVDVAGGIVLDADDSGTLSLKDAGTRFGILQKSGNNFEIQSAISDGDIVFKGTDGGSGITALTLDMSGAGLAIFNAGIAVGGTGAANTLDDYEEGTWSPQIHLQNAGNQSNASNQTQDGRYTKIGNIVTLQFSLIFTLPSSLSNDNIGIKNLPFTSSATIKSVGGVMQSTSLTSGAGYLLFIEPSEDKILLLTGAGGGNLADEVGTGSGKQLFGSIVYQTG